MEEGGKKETTEGRRGRIEKKRKNRQKKGWMKEERKWENK